MRVSEALERYETLAGDDLAGVELMVALEAGLTELDQLLAEDNGNQDLRAGILLLKVALRRMAAYVGD